MTISEEYRIFDEDGKEVEDPDGTIIDEVYDQVMMEASEDLDEGPDPDAARDRALERKLSGRGEYDD